MAQVCQLSLSSTQASAVIFVYLTEAVSLIGLPFMHDIPANLADNSEVLLPVYEAIVLWDGEEREVLVIATGRQPLLGTALLDEQELVIQFTEGGLVTIEEL